MNGQGLESRHAQEFPFSKTSRPATGSTSIGVFFRGQSGRGVKLTTHLYLELNEQLFFCFSCMPGWCGQGLLHLPTLASVSQSQLRTPLTVLTMIQTSRVTTHTNTHAHTKVKNTETGTNQLLENYQSGQAQQFKSLVAH